MGYLTHKTSLNSSSFGEECVVGITTHIKLLIDIQTLELALINRKKTTLTCIKNEVQIADQLSCSAVTETTVPVSCH